MTKHTPKASKMEPKSEVRHPLNRQPPGDPVKMGAMSNPYIICYVLCTFAFLKKANIVYKTTQFLGKAFGLDFGEIWGRFWERFGTLGTPKCEKKRVRKTCKQMLPKKSRGRCRESLRDRSGGP